MANTANPRVRFWGKQNLHCLKTRTTLGLNRDGRRPKILVWHSLVNLSNICMADFGRLVVSRYLKYWYGSCHTLPPGSTTPVIKVFACTEYEGFQRTASIGVSEYIKSVVFYARTKFDHFINL